MLHHNVQGQGTSIICASVAPVGELEWFPPVVGDRSVAPTPSTPLTSEPRGGSRSAVSFGAFSIEELWSLPYNRREQCADGARREIGP